MKTQPPFPPRPARDQSRDQPLYDRGGVSLGAARKAQKNLVHIAGIAAVEAVFARDPDRVERLYYEDRMKPKVGGFCSILAKSRKPYRVVTAEEMERITGSALHGGVAAAARAQTTLVLEMDKARVWAQDKKPLLLLDGVSNPHNLGAIVRTAAFFGIPRVGLSDHPAQARLSDAAYRVAEGGFEYLETCRVTDFAATLEKLRAYYHVVAAAPGNFAPLTTLQATDKPVALVLGNEEEGLPPATLKACDAVVAIHGAGHIQSLNVSTCAAILLHAVAAKV